MMNEAEQNHLTGKHRTTPENFELYAAALERDCGFCKRRLVREKKKQAKRKKFFASA